MQSKILESIGIDPAYILIVMFLILIIWEFSWSLT